MYTHFPQLQDRLQPSFSLAEWWQRCWTYGFMSDERYLYNLYLKSSYSFKNTKLDILHASMAIMVMKI